MKKILFVLLFLIFASVSYAVQLGGNENVFPGVSNSNYSKFENDGTMVMLGDATVWDDLRVALTSGRLGANAKPDFDEVNVGYLFPQNDAAEILYLITQLPHDYEEGSSIIPHIHWLQTSASTPTFKIDYMWIDIEATTTTFTTAEAVTHTKTYVTGAMHQMTEFPTITGTGKTISSIFVCRLYRSDNNVSGDVLAWEFDIHYKKDTLGSRGDKTK